MASVAAAAVSRNADHLGAAPGQEQQEGTVAGSQQMQTRHGAHRELLRCHGSNWMPEINEATLELTRGGGISILAQFESR